MKTSASFIALAVCLAVLLSSISVLAQQKAPQPADDSVKRINRLMDRTREVTQTLQKDVDKKPAQAAQFQRVQRLSTALSETAAQVKATLEAYQDMSTDQALMADPEIQKSLQQTREQLGGMMDRLEAAVQATEQMAKKLHFGTTGK